jgi:group I intron endonuclease
MTIYKAIIKYGYANFKLEILEYCNPSDVLLREQYYLDLLKPEYNILKIAGSTSGYKHKGETLKKFKTRKFSNETLANITEAAKGRVLSKEIRTKISVARLGIKLSNETRAKLSAITTVKKGIAVKVTNIVSGEINQYATLTLAALALGVSRTAVKKAMVLGTVLKKTYVINIKTKNKNVLYFPLNG